MKLKNEWFGWGVDMKLWGEFTANVLLLPRALFQPTKYMSLNLSYQALVLMERNGKELLYTTVSGTFC